METKAKSSRILDQMMNYSVRMVEVPVILMRFPVNMMASGMKTVTETIQETQRKSDIRGESDDSDDSDEAEGGRESGFRRVSRTVMAPCLEMFKLPQNLFVSSMKSMVDTVQDLRNESAPDRGASSEAEREAGEEEVIEALTPEEAALEAESALPEDVEELPGRSLWQIGRPGRKDFEGKWAESFDYHVGKDLDALNSPQVPHFIAVKGASSSDGGTEQLNIHFSLERDYKEGELAFVYDRWGGEKDQVRVDGDLLTAVRGVGKGKFRRVALALKSLPIGDHVISITTTGKVEGGGHRIDSLTLAELNAPGNGAGPE